MPVRSQRKPATDAGFSFSGSSKLKPVRIHRQHIVLAILVAVAILAGWEEFGPRKRVTPAGQPPLMELQSAEPVQHAFNAAPDAVRVIVLLSPT